MCFALICWGSRPLSTPSTTPLSLETRDEGRIHSTRKRAQALVFECFDLSLPTITSACQPPITCENTWNKSRDRERNGRMGRITTHSPTRYVYYWKPHLHLLINCFYYLQAIFSTSRRAAPPCYVETHHRDVLDMARSSRFLERGFPWRHTAPRPKSRDGRRFYYYYCILVNFVYIMYFITKPLPVPAEDTCVMP